MAAETISTGDAVTAYRTAINGHASKIDARKPYDQGALSTIQVGGAWESSVGTPGEAGREFLVTSGYAVPLLFKDTGTGWRPLSMLTFSARPSANTNTLATSFAKLVCDTEEWDDAGFYNPATYRFNPQIAGIYRLSGTLRTNSNAGDGVKIGLAVFKNGSVHRAFDPRAHSGSAVGALSASGSALVSANGSSDYFELFGFATVGGLAYAGVEVDDGGMVATQFQGELVRPA